MTFPQVTISQINTHSGQAREIARTVLLLGLTGDDDTQVPTATPVNAKSDFDALLGTADSAFKRNIQAFFDNAGQNATAYLMTCKTADKWLTSAVKSAQQSGSFEGIVVYSDAGATRDLISEATTSREQLINEFARRTWFLLSCRGVNDSESWADYLAAMTTLAKDLVAPAVQLVPLLFGNEAGVLAGRLCNNAVTLADSPARVATGAVVNIGKTRKPADHTGQPLDLATLKALNTARFSVPAWYEDYEGIYWADGVTLDANGGDYQAIEYLRVTDEVARRVRLMAIAKIADRSLNSTPASIAAHKQLFARPMRNMSKSLQINGVFFPGECMPPREGDVEIVWPKKDVVQIALVVRPYNSPKQIQVSILLDSNTETK